MKSQINTGCCSTLIDPYYFGETAIMKLDLETFSATSGDGKVVSRPNGPTVTSEFEHSSIPASIKKIFNLRSSFLTRRDAWAGTFENLFTELNAPRTDCPDVLPDVVPLRGSEVSEDNLLSEFQRELVDLACALTGDFPLASMRDESRKQMTVKEADGYVTHAVSTFIQASKEAIDSGTDQSAIVDMKKSLKSTEIKSP